MISIIAHRGNFDGPSTRENHPDQIRTAIRLGYDVEIDIRYDGRLWSLGHDYPQYDITSGFIQEIKHKTYFHAKDFESLNCLLAGEFVGARVFFHKNDDYTLTSDGYIWTYPLQNVKSRSIIVCQSEYEVQKYIKSPAYGICSDYCLLASTLSQQDLSQALLTR